MPCVTHGWLKRDPPLTCTKGREGTDIHQMLRRSERLNKKPPAQVEASASTPGDDGSSDRNPKRARTEKRASRNDQYLQIGTSEGAASIEQSRSLTPVSGIEMIHWPRLTMQTFPPIRWATTIPSSFSAKQRAEMYSQVSDGRVSCRRPKLTSKGAGFTTPSTSKSHALILRCKPISRNCQLYTEYKHPAVQPASTARYRPPRPRYQVNEGLQRATGESPCTDIV